MTAKSAGDRFGLVLGAGGVLGAAWSIGALRAFQEETGRDPRDADVIVGTSAGSVLAAFLGCGISPETMANHQRGVVAHGDPDITYDYETDSGGHLPPLPRLRLGSTELLLNTARHPTRVPPIVALSAFLPLGRGTLDPVGAMVDAVAPAGETAWANHARTWIVATDFQSGRRVAFGRPDSPPARLSRAVMASCAIPGWYAPVEIAGRRYVDGGTSSPTSLDLLAGEGLDDVYVLSPMTSFEFDSPVSVGVKLERHVRRMFTKRLVREADKVRATGTRVTLIGPGPEDLIAIGGNLMDHRRREAVFETSVVTSARSLRSARLPAAG